MSCVGKDAAGVSVGEGACADGSEEDSGGIGVGVFSGGGDGVGDGGCSAVGCSVVGSEDDETGLELFGDRVKPTANAIALASTAPAMTAPKITRFCPLFCCMTGLVPTGTVCGGTGFAIGGVERYGAWGKPPGATATVAISEAAPSDCKALSISLAVEKRSRGVNRIARSITVARLEWRFGANWRHNNSPVRSSVCNS